MQGTIAFSYPPLVRNQRSRLNPDGSASKASIFITGIDAPDGIAVDEEVCAN
jgi:hypothetical protein